LTRIEMSMFSLSLTPGAAALCSSSG
jgi:hypothetical protein